MSEHLNFYCKCSYDSQKCCSSEANYPEECIYTVCGSYCSIITEKRGEGEEKEIEGKGKEGKGEGSMGRERRREDK